ncbi:MAG: hypothetical protein H6638_12605 [Ardenticatenales bacterium]|nr:hypothetical protein [Ardenticatenales bacterium]
MFAVLQALALLLLRPTAPAHAEQQGCTVANNVATVGAADHHGRPLGQPHGQQRRAKQH